MNGYHGIFLRSLRDLIRWPILREVLVTGIPLGIGWLGIGWMLWKPLLTVTTRIISWVPFSIVKADGALLILFFLWAVAVLVSYAVLTALLAPLWFRKMHKGYYFYSFSALSFFAVLWGWLIVANWGTLQHSIADKLLVWLPFQTVAEGSAWLLNFYIFYSFYILSLYLVLSLYRKDFLYAVREIEYPDFPLPETKTPTRHRFIALRDGALYIVLTVLFLPLLMIPIVNVLIQLFLWAWLYRDANFRGTCAIYCTPKAYERLRAHRFTIWGIAFFASMLNFVPIINIFTPFFAQLMAFHWIVQEQLREKE
ncbi:EI24 domain-containing protein [Nitratifractor sp.]